MIGLAFVAPDILGQIAPGVVADLACGQEQAAGPTLAIADRVKF
jgi:hypothetical protein